MAVAEISLVKRMTKAKNAVRIWPGGSRFWDLPLFWKLLLPSVVLITVLGVVGGYVIVRDLADRAHDALDQQLSRASLDARSVLTDRQQYLIESGNFASNLKDAAAAIRFHNTHASARLLQSVLALKPDVDDVAAISQDGAAVIELVRSAPESRPRQVVPQEWSRLSFVKRALADTAGGKFLGFARADGRPLLAIATPVCTARERCAAVGATIAGIRLDRIAGETLQRVTAPEAGGAAVTIYDENGSFVAGAGRWKPQFAAPSGGSVRRTARFGGTDVATLYTSFEGHNARLGTVAVSLPSGAGLSAVRRTGVGLALFLIAAMAVIVGVGAVLTRVIVRQVRDLVSTSRALGRGDLGARVDVRGNDEFGELAVRMNEMAEQLQADYETLELRVAERTEEVERLLRERSDFFAAVSHELRTPLAVILREADMLLDPAYRRADRKSAGLALKDSGGQLAGLINDILKLAEAEAGAVDLDLERINVTNVLDEVRGTIVALARGAGIRASIEAPKRLPAVMADRRRLREVILNLVSNAVKYTPEGGRVRVQAEATPKDVVIVVTDTGVGIPEDVGERIFDPFYRVDGITPQRGEASSGLGLAVARRLVEAHGGALNYESAMGSGTTFTLTLPRTDKEGR